jgi:predicted cupin superfamily sugar epimerase
MVSQLGEEIKTQNVQPRPEVGYFREHYRAAVPSYLGFVGMGSDSDFC